MKTPPSHIATLLADHAKLSHALATVQDASTQQEYLLRLLQADLRNYRLIYGLEQAGLVIDHFYSNLHTVIIPMLGFPPEQSQDDTVGDFYFELLEQQMELPLREFWIACRR